METSALPVLEDARFRSIAEAHKILAPVMHAIASAVGNHCEVVLHDLSTRDLDHTIYAIINGHVSGREVGGPSTNLGIEVLRDESADHNAFGYRGRTADGRDLQSSSVYYRNPEGQIIAALCINIDLSPAQAAMNLLGTLLPQSGATTQPKELVSPDISSVLDEMVTEALTAVGKAAHLMDKRDRIEVLRILDARGAFAVKRSADHVAKRLGVSRVTVYGYLDEIRNG